MQFIREDENFQLRDILTFALKARLITDADVSVTGTYEGDRYMFQMYTTIEGLTGFKGHRLQMVNDDIQSKSTDYVLDNLKSQLTNDDLECCINNIINVLKVGFELPADINTKEFYINKCWAITQ